jgi:hypothetical protein
MLARSCSVIYLTTGCINAAENGGMSEAQQKRQTAAENAI